MNTNWIKTRQTKYAAYAAAYIVVVVALTALLLFGFPVALSIGATAFFFGRLASGLQLFSLLPLRVWGQMTNMTLVAVPLFVFMGLVLERSGIADELLEALTRMFGPIRGGLAISVILVGAMLAASTGIVGGIMVTMGLIALPEMLKRRYDTHMACGSVLAGGTLGILIPPSIMLIVYGMIDNSSIGQLYAGAFLPGFLLAGLYIGYISIRCFINPSMGPPIPVAERPTMGEKIRTLWPVIPSAILIFLVLGSIVLGIASPTEAAGVGALGALIIAAVRRTLSWKGLLQFRLEAGRDAQEVCHAFL